MYYKVIVSYLYSSSMIVCKTLDEAKKTANLYRAKKREANIWQYDEKGATRVEY